MQPTETQRAVAVTADPGGHTGALGLLPASLLLLLLALLLLP